MVCYRGKSRWFGVSSSYMLSHHVIIFINQLFVISNFKSMVYQCEKNYLCAKTKSHSSAVLLNWCFPNYEGVKNPQFCISCFRPRPHHFHYCITAALPQSHLLHIFALWFAHEMWYMKSNQFLCGNKWSLLCC